MMMTSAPPASLTDTLRTHLAQPLAERRPILVVCIGTDRSTGDSFGPFTGSLLKSTSAYPYIYGTLSQPIHSRNFLAETAHLYDMFTDPYIIAVDASLGASDMIGCIRIRQGSIRPAAAFSRELPPIGSLAVTGVVGVSGIYDYQALQSARLGLVAHMASQLAGALCASLPTDRI